MPAVKSKSKTGLKKTDTSKEKKAQKRKQEDVEKASSRTIEIRDPDSVGEEKTLFSWKAPVRPFKKRDRDYYTTIGAIAFLVIVIMVFLKEFLLIAVVIAFAFVSYVLASIPPEKVEHKLTNRGIRTENKLYRWEELRRYWLSEKFGQKLIHVQTVFLFPGQLLLLVGEGNEDKIKDVFNERLPYDEPEPTFLDKSSSWLSEKIPLEKQESSSQEKKVSNSS